MALDILNKFTNHLKNTLVEAINLSIRLKHPQVLPMHLLVSLSEQSGSIATEIITQHKLTTTILQPHLEHLQWIHQQRTYTLPQLSAEVVRVLEHAAVIAFEHHHKYIGTEHLLLSLLDMPDNQVAQVLKIHKINLDQVRKQTVNVLNSTTRFPDVADLFHEEADNESDGAILATSEPDQKSSTQKSLTPALDFFSVNLTDTVTQQTIDPVIGRTAEIDRLIHVLSRRTKNNPLLIGEPGVGKTAIIEGLAKRILERQVPLVLLDKKIYRLDLSLVVAGTMYRGEFEARFKQIIDELKAHPNIILFIDEIHTIIGAGSGGNAMDAANILKPSLARGEIRCIGATTAQEYQKYIESDTALERRFRPIYVSEPSIEEAMQVLSGIKVNYEQFHHVTITDEAIAAAVKLSSRYITDKFLPDKAIDLIDEAAARYTVQQPAHPLETALAALEHKLIQLQSQKLHLIKQERFEQVITLKQQERDLKQQVHDLKQQLANTKSIVSKGSITAADIASVISQISGIPLTELVAPEKKRLLALADELNARVVGQTEATATVAKLIQRSRAGLHAPHRPIGSFMFLGPSGVGKTELAKTLARVVFGSEQNIIRIDMSEFSESFTISKLIGAPAGYVGYKEGAKLTDQVKHKPYSLILFDEIEKAHPDVFNILLQILDEGHLTDGTGKRVNFKNTIIIMTSNIGLEHFQAQAALGFAAPTSNDTALAYDTVKKQVLDELPNHFRPEFLNRIDNIVVFKPLTEADLVTIVRLQLNELFARAEERNIQLSASQPLLRHIAKLGYTPVEGARAIRRTIETELENVLAEKILADELQPGDKVKLGYLKDKITFTKK